jgi:hypothetical protein
MLPFDLAALNDFYARISAEEGVAPLYLQDSLADLFSRPRSDADINSYRLSAGLWKKLADEVVPVSKFLRAFSIGQQRVRFPLNDKPPDAWLWHQGSHDPIGIEVTIAQARERFHLARELIGSRMGRGFIGVADDAPQASFDRAMSRQRVMFSTPQALEAVGSGILRALTRKNDPTKYAGFTLVVVAPLFSLPRERWTAIVPRLKLAAARLPFHSVYVLSNASENLWGIQIK